MIYIDSVTKISDFPRTSKEDATSIDLVNQLDKKLTTANVVNVSTNNTRYRFDLSALAFTNGQYDYHIKNSDGSVIDNGILQYGNYTPSTVGYSHEINIIQYGE